MKLNLKRQIKKHDGRIVKKRKFVFYTIEQPQKFLNWLISEGFLLHGSSREIIGALVPQQANDLAKEFGNKKAIYLTQDPLVAIFCALTGGVKGIKIRRNSIRSRLNQLGNIEYIDTNFAVSDTEKIQKIGYVYVFTKEVIDEQENNEFISKKPIKPQLVIQIKRKDFPYPIRQIKE